MRVGRAAVAGASTVLALAWCAMSGLLSGGDPMLVVEIAASAFLIVWATFILREVWSARTLGRRFASQSTDAIVGGVPCRVLGGMSHEAIVIGALAPIIYVGAGLLAVLDEEERRGVLLHEEYHRRTRAPLRAAALEAWLRLARRPRILERLLSERIADLEVGADAFAMAAGATPSALASALLKGQAGPAPGASFAGASERRIGALLDAARGSPPRRRRPPLEWLPLAFVGVAVLGCHLGIVAGLS